MHVREIWRYPVKSLGGERVETAAADQRGIDGDRMWGILDPATGLVLTGRREPPLLFLSARHRPGGRPLITTEDGTELTDDGALSAWIGRPVTLVSALDGSATFENPRNVEDETDWFRWESAGATFHDGRSTVSVASTETLGDWDPRRFRMNVIVDGGGEDALDGAVTIGSVRLQVRKPIERCVMVTRPQPGISKDLGVLKRIIAERDNRLGLGLVVTDPGTLAIGDELVAAPTGG